MLIYIPATKKKRYLKALRSSSIKNKIWITNNVILILILEEQVLVFQWYVILIYLYNIYIFRLYIFIYVSILNNTMRWEVRELFQFDVFQLWIQFLFCYRGSFICFTNISLLILFFCSVFLVYYDFFIFSRDFLINAWFRFDVYNMSKEYIMEGS